MIKVFLLLTILAAFTVSATSTLAAPFKAYDKNPNVVAFYPGPNDRHEIVGEEGQNHFGMDLVMQRGNSGNIQQWFYGTSEAEGLHGEHSVWNISNDGTCADNWHLIPDAYPDWGYHLQPNTDYCVKTNDFHPSN